MTRSYRSISPFLAVVIAVLLSVSAAALFLQGPPPAPPTWTVLDNEGPNTIFYNGPLAQNITVTNGNGPNDDSSIKVYFKKSGGGNFRPPVTLANGGSVTASVPTNGKVRLEDVNDPDDDDGHGTYIIH